MMSTPAPSYRCDRYEECKERHMALEARVQRVEARVQSQGEMLSALKAQVATAAAFGSLAGGGLVAVFLRFLK